MCLPTILYVEDNEMMRLLVQEMLEAEGWRVDVCADGTIARGKLESDDYYDLLLFDNDLPGISGLELTRHARRLDHRRHTPIVIFSAGYHQMEARRAGATVCLKKPDDIRTLVEHLAPLLAVSESLMCC